MRCLYRVTHADGAHTVGEKEFSSTFAAISWLGEQYPSAQHYFAMPKQAQLEADALDDSAWGIGTGICSRLVRSQPTQRGATI